MATGEQGTKDFPFHLENMDDVPASLIFRESVGRVVLENPLRTESWVRAADAAARK